MKKLSRKIVWLLLIVFVFTVGSGFSVRRSAALPGVGEQLSGFRVEKIERLDTPGGKTAYLTHEATGAAVVYIEDTGASPAITLMARTTDGLRRVTLAADSAAELLRGAKESLGAFFGAETEAVPGAEAAYRAFLTYLLPGSDTAGNGAGPVSAENMLAVVCADADGAEDILSWLDGVFSAADAGEALAPDAAYCRIEKPVKETVSLAGEGTGGVYFGIVCPRAGEWTRVRLAALAAAQALGIPIEDAAQALSLCQGVRGRAEVVPTDTDYTVLIDYAHTPDGLKNILSTVCGFADARVLVVFGCGGDRDRTKRAEMGRIAARLADEVIVTSDNPRTENPYAILHEILAGMADSATPFAVLESRREAIAYALDHARTGDVVVLAGKGHETYQVVGAETLPLDERQVVREHLSQ